MFPEVELRETLRFKVNKINRFPRDQSISVYHYIYFMWKDGLQEKLTCCHLLYLQCGMHPNHPIMMYQDHQK